MSSYPGKAVYSLAKALLTSISRKAFAFAANAHELNKVKADAVVYERKRRREASILWSSSWSVLVVAEEVAFALRRKYNDLTGAFRLPRSTKILWDENPNTGGSSTIVSARICWSRARCFMLTLRHVFYTKFYTLVPGMLCCVVTALFFYTFFCDDTLACWT